MLVSHLESLGFKINETKSCLVPTQEIVYLGLRLNSDQYQAFLSEECIRYVLRGERVRMCTEKGWNGTDPICEVSKIICSAPAVANRLIKPGERTQYAPQDTVTIVCSEGFELIGLPDVTCGPDGQWQGLPQCRSKVITCSDPTVAHGRITPGSGVYKHKDTVDVVCNDGFDLSGPAKVTCGPDGQWQALPECRPKNISGKCGPAPSHPHAFPRDPMRKEYPSGKKCGSAGEISNGHFEYTGVSFGDSATAVCQEGYELIGPKLDFKYCKPNAYGFTVAYIGLIDGLHMCVF
ncbi:CUB and sushi domain-containing 3-like protein [Labeo rohita]|uniref:CUB and sushi domain-containing 3-like protein n=1 Tax=Labeo rohita TaxID=84645 RepID=A0A498NRX3_LABRO|nr:CUB and sushi domain-containing 3-like protein [Labeo rohita]